MLRQVGVWTVGGAVIGVLLAWVAGAVDPVMVVLSASGLAAYAAFAAGHRDPRATLTMRLVIAALYVAVGVVHPTPLGIAVAAFGVGFGVVACLTVRAEVLSARVALSVRSSDGLSSADIELIGAAPVRCAVRLAATALGRRTEWSSCWLERGGVALKPRRSLVAAGVRSGDVLTLVTGTGDAVQHGRARVVPRWRRYP